MLRLIAAGFGGVLLSVVLCTSGSQVGAANAATPDLEEIMKIVYKPKGLHKSVGKALEAPNPDWTDISKMTKDYAKLVGSMPQIPVPKGSADSWKKLTKQSADDAKALDTAATKKDKPAALAAWGKLNKSCQTCHDEHR